MLHALSPASGSRSKRKRVGRGNASGRGTTSGRGHKGQQARSGAKRNFGFEGGQTPLLRRQPKLGGFTPPRQVKYQVVNLGTLEEKLDAGSYDTAALREHKLISGKKPVKILGRGEVKKKFVLKVDAASDAALEAVKKAGGSIEVTSA